MSEMIRKVGGLAKGFVMSLYALYDKSQIADSSAKLRQFYFSLFLDSCQLPDGLPSEAVAIKQSLDKIGKIPLLPPLVEPTVSVIIPHYNQPVFLREALAALATQTVKPEEVIIVDDISTNISKSGLETLVDEFKAHLEIKLVIANQKLYAGRARQLGADVASGAILIMHDADDVSHPQRIEFTKKLFKLHDNLYHLNIGFVQFRGGFFPYIRQFVTSELMQRIYTPDKLKERQAAMFEHQLFSTRKIYGINFGDYSIGDFQASGGHVAYRKELAAYVKWPSPDNFYFTAYEDYDFNFILFLALKGSASYTIDLPLFYYRQGSTTNQVYY
ncbi:glycosyltransferase family 2 protein [Hymenobacter properus]|uniref:Glycosyltransferase family 2 protein n=1 Tax=Hymenobacter properus TaxID=2791026 RepID=A0A931BJ33_9BACT|nr:glycosyltransferase family A protein [Hymenobacter properus]MBF9143436.1 glycosyltransferase family 2 protein [Hymenobacter properus]MBR7722249.1 glycosyltransferase family 2 protein [Microvirga sp. SRT04]